jgi:hypothetical protein
MFQDFDLDYNETEISHASVRAAKNSELRELMASCGVTEGEMSKSPGEGVRSCISQFTSLARWRWMARRNRHLDTSDAGQGRGTKRPA